MAFLQKGSSGMCTGSAMFTSNLIRNLEPKLPSIYIGRRGTCLLTSPQRRVTSPQCRVNASAVPPQLPALPRQFPALPRQFPAVPPQTPAMPPHPISQGPMILDCLTELNPRFRVVVGLAASSSSSGVLLVSVVPCLLESSSSTGFF
jgi:hypothetical protein